LLNQAGSVAGKEQLRALAPATTPEAVRAALGLTTEAAVVLRTAGAQPYHDLPDMGEVVPASRVEGLHLEPAVLADVASFIEGATEISAFVARIEAAPRLARRASEVKDLSEIARAIRHAILPSREVADHASPKLAETRRAIVRLKAQLQSVMESLLRSRDTERILQDKLVTTRNERCVVLVKVEHRGQLPGIIHGASGSGASLFVEPLPAVELNNDIVSLADEERREVVRILQALTARIGARAADFAQAVEILGELDAAQAKALLARDMDAVEPVVDDGVGAPELDLRDARHPLLMGRLAERLGLGRRASREPVPVSLRFGLDAPVLVISGPNTGGKTVALKTVGLLALMAQSGLHVPAAPGSRLPVFRRIFADIGDEQSIAENLSTFSAHLATIVEMTRDLESPALVLLDEVGAGTDPTEGGGLGVAIVDYFRQRGAMVVATTHHGLMKAYAQSTPGVACASFGYDPDTYEPTYRLSHGVPGRSLALEMAERLGLPASVVADARSRLDLKEAQAEALLKRLEERQAALQREEARLACEREEITARAASVSEAERAIETRKRGEVEAFVRDLRQRGAEAARQAADAIQKAVQRVEAARKSALSAGSQARSEALIAIRAAHEEVLREPELSLPPEPEVADELRVGGRARVRSLGVVGELLSLPRGGDAELAVGGKRMRVPRAELVPLAGPAPRPAGNPAAFLGVKPRGGAPAEVNVVGLTVDEALPRVDKLLDDAAVAERKQIRVIHGFGEGRLRKAVAGLLDGHPHVAAFRAGGAGEGGGGVTIVELKE